MTAGEPSADTTGSPHAARRVPAARSAAASSCAAAARREATIWATKGPGATWRPSSSANSTSSASP